MRLVARPAFGFGWSRSGLKARQLMASQKKRRGSILNVKARNELARAATQTKEHS
jgi:hypothetical protein